MHAFLDILLVSGKKGFELAFFVLMPIMVFMMAFMRILDKKGILRQVALLAAPVLILFGLPGFGVFAMLQILLVSFAAPISTFRIMDQEIDISERKIAAALAGIFCMSQANATFPLALVGLNLGVTMASSVVGCLFASFVTYRYFARHLPDHVEHVTLDNSPRNEEQQNLIQIIMTGAEEGFQLVLKALPLLVLAILMVNVLKTAGVISLIEWLFAPVLSLVGISGAAVLSIVTKYIAGGTAMMGATMPMVQEKIMSVTELNKIAGFTIHTLDPVGLALYGSAGKRFPPLMTAAIKGALAGILLRGIIHLVIF